MRWILIDIDDLLGIDLVHRIACMVHDVVGGCNLCERRQA